VFDIGLEDIEVLVLDKWAKRATWG
jgi:hypothetical protein